MPSSTMPDIDLNHAAEALFPDMQRWRRHLHRNPELSGQEESTARFIADQLQAWDIPFEQQIGGHGIAARITHKNAADTPWIALRGDMDALPIQDAKQSDYHSTHEQTCHACGHDAHTTMMLGAARILLDHNEHLSHNILLIFQPAEETCEGALAMIKAEIFKDVQPERIHALHVSPYLPTGVLGMREGTMCAAADMFEVRISGRGGHAAKPHECDDVVLVASQMILSLHHIVSRNIDPVQAAVLTIGEVHAGHAPNVIPDQARFSGTIRSFEDSVHARIRTRMDQIIRQTAESYGVEVHFQLHQSIPVLRNHPETVRTAVRKIETHIPDANIIHIEHPSMGGEDFAHFLDAVPGCLIRLGTGGSPETRYPLHHPCFDIDETAMITGAAALASLCL